MKDNVLFHMLNVMNTCSLRNRYIVVAVGEETKSLYTWNIYNGKIMCDYSNKDIDLNFTSRDNIECLDFEDKNFIVKSYREIQYKIDGTEFANQAQVINNDSALFLKVFRILKDTARFTVLLEDRYISCIFLHGKVYYAEETDSDITVNQTRIFDVGMGKRFSILNISPLCKPLTLDRYISKWKDKAYRCGKRYNFNKYKR